MRFLTPSSTHTCSTARDGVPLTECFPRVVQAGECLIGVKMLDSILLEDRKMSQRGAHLRRHPRDRRAGEHNPQLSIPPPPAPVGVPPCSQPILGVLRARKPGTARALWPLAARCSAVCFALICAGPASPRWQDRV